VPFALLTSSPLVPGLSPIEIFYRDEGEGPPLVLLHGGWGYSLSPFNRQIEKLRSNFRLIAPDRSGYGRSNHSGKFGGFSIDFHYRAAAETLSLLDSLGIERAFLWGHSDGAVIAAIIGFTAPERVRGLVLEAFHYYRTKPGSREFFETIAYKPEAMGSELCERFALEFGRDQWLRQVTGHAKAWFQLAAESGSQRADLYRGELSKISAPTLIIHGRLDPRTEPGELDSVRAELPGAEMQILEGAAHSPHSESASADLVTEVAKEFLTRQVTTEERA
jgi:pimeloyl-ACP methyl ester carboxylesterase